MYNIINSKYSKHTYTDIFDDTSIPLHSALLEKIN